MPSRTISPIAWRCSSQSSRRPPTAAFPFSRPRKTGSGFPMSSATKSPRYRCASPGRARASSTRSWTGSSPPRPAVPRPRPLTRRGLDALEGAAAWLLFGLSRLLPVAWASVFAGWLARAVGPRLGISRRARQNLRRALPELDDARVDEAIRGMWDNLGRVAAEYAHLGKYRVYERGGGVEMVGA